MDLIKEQERLECEMIGLGMDNYRTAQRAAYERGQASDTAPLRGLTRAVVPVLAEEIRKFVFDAYHTGKPGRRNVAAKYLGQFEPEVIAFISLRRMLDPGRIGKALTHYATDIGNALKVEKQLEELITQDPERFSLIKRSFKTNHRAHRMRVYQYHLKDAEIDLDWSYKDLVMVGTKCVDMVIEHTKLFYLFRTSGKRKRHYEVRPTERLQAWVRDQDARCELLQPFMMPMVIPPKDWDKDGMGGGYSLGLGGSDSSPFGLYKAHQGAVSPTVVEALNEVQRTPWRVSEALLGVLQHVWERNHHVGGVPGRDPIDLPGCPRCGNPVEPKDQGGHTCLAEDEEARKVWRRLAAKVHAERVSMNDRRLQVSQTLFIANRVKGYDRIYFPHKLDFRGRMYPMPVHLHPQGPDYARALLQFAEGKPINTPEQEGWLMIHGANLWGHDKVDLEGRIAWVEEHDAFIRECGQLPLAYRWWTEADKPFQFLAFCMEYYWFKREGYGYVSHLPITVDGSCNGLQHFSAMLRDEVGGRAVNLVPQEEPADVYQEVADVVAAEMWRLEQEGDPLARQWLDFGITRKTVKRSVMIVPYSGTRNACRKYIEEHIKERGREAMFEDTFKASVFLAKFVWDAIETVIRSSREVMSWLRICAKAHAKTNKPLVWVNPLGFPMTQWYPDWTEHRLETRFGETLNRLTLTYKEDTDKVRADRMMNGISPNFVHSMDACALMLTVLYGKDNGITGWMVIHDCYGTHAADMPMLAACIREAFIDLYKLQDPLASFHEQILAQLPEGLRGEIPEPPEKGNLNLGMVRHSDFFFA